MSRDPEMAKQAPPEDEAGRLCAPAKAGWCWRRYLPLALIALGLLAVYLTGSHQYLSFSALTENREILVAFVGENTALALALYIAAYAVAVALSLPGGAVLTIAGGFLFGLWAGTVATIIGATIGAIGIFLAARTALGTCLKHKVGPWLGKLEAGFRANALSYLLVLRLVPLFPFWLVNLVPAFLGVPLRTYAIGTFLGIIPGSFVFVSIGNGLGAVLDRGEAPDLSIIFKPEILTPILGLAFLALLPVIYKHLKHRNRAAAASDQT
jgi:uncharacterized membrane protein YdjX (TVP38/TMEM64 family)